MNQCQRGCCWSPFSCAKAYKCPCHRPTFREWAGLPIRDHSHSDYADPTANKAIRNVMRARNKK